MDEASSLIFYYFGSLGLILLLACLIRVMIIRKRYREAERMINQGYTFHSMSVGNSRAVLVQPPQIQRQYSQPPPYSSVVPLQQQHVISQQNPHLIPEYTVNNIGRNLRY